MRLKENLQRVQKGLPLLANPVLSSAVHWTPAENFPVHRWFRYREGFSPSLLEFFPDAKDRLDPFCGCGTTLLESSKRGIRSYGIDLNPLATFITRVKTQTYSKRDCVEFIRLFSQAAKNCKAIDPAGKPDYPLLNKLFLPRSLETLLRLRAFIDSLPRRRVHELLFLAWLSILEDASNVFKEGNGLKYRNKRRRPGRYETIPDKEWIPQYFGRDVPGFVLRLWHLKCEQMAEDLEGFHSTIRYTPEVRTGSCLDTGSCIK